MMKRWAVVLPLLVLACGPKDENGDGIADGIREPDSVTVVAPATPKGTVSGQVLNTRRKPLAGAQVKLLIGSGAADGKYSLQTDADGNFMFNDVPAGSSVLVTVSKEGHATLRASTVVPSSAGNIPINNANASLGVILLAETQSTLSFTLVTNENRPAAGAQALIEAFPAAQISAADANTLVGSSTVLVSATADATGLVKFEGLPSPAELTRLGTPLGSKDGTDSTAYYRLWVDPADINGDTIIDTGGYSAPISASSLLLNNTQIIKLNPAKSDGSNTEFKLLTTNVPSLKSTMDKKPMINLLRPGEAIYLGFSHPVARDSLVVLLTNEQGQTVIDLNVTASKTGDTFLLTPPVTSVPEGQEYNLILRATSAYNGEVLTRRGYFVSGDAKSPRPLAFSSVTFKDGNTGTPNVLDAGECGIVTFNQLLTTTSVPVDVTLSGVDGKTFTLRLLPAPYPSPTLNACFSGEAVKLPIDTANFATTSRFYFVYGSPAEAANYPSINPALVTARVRLDFISFQKQDFTQYYETAWGAPVPYSLQLEATLAR